MSAAAVEEVSARFDAHGASVSGARRFVARALREWGLDALVDDAALLVSELVTNAIVHAGTRTDVTCLLREDGVRIDVVDRYPGRWLPAKPPVADDDAEGGRGLALAAALSSAWGVSYTHTTKSVWFLLPLGAVDAVRDVAGAAPGMSEGDVEVAGPSTGAAVVHLDAAGAVTAWDDGAAALLGRQAQDVVGLSWHDVLGEMPPATAAPRQAVHLVRRPDREGIAVHATYLAAASGGTLVLLSAGEQAPPGLAPRPVTAAATDLPDDDDLGLREALALRLQLDSLLQRVVERARNLLGGDTAFALVVDEDAERLALRAGAGVAAHALHARSLVEAEPQAWREPGLFRDVAAGGAGPATDLVAGTGIAALVTVPMLVDSRVVGVLGVGHGRAGRFVADDVARLQRAADRVALAVQTARIVELERQRRGWLSFLAEASDLLAGTLDHDMTLALLCQLVVPHLGTWCAVHEIDELGNPRLVSAWHADEERVDAVRALLAKATPPLPGQGVRAVALEWRPGDGLDLAGGPPGLEALARDDALAVPLVARGRVLGTLTLGGGDGLLARDRVDVAEDLCRRAALALDNARLYSEQTATAQALQRSLLPPQLPDVPGADVGVVYQAAGAGNEVGGDFYDVFAVDERRWGFAVGDVCGKGPEAAAVTGLARQALRLLGRAGYAVPDVLARLNAAILEEGARGRFITVVAGHLEPRAGGGLRLGLVCAGHPQPLVLRAAGGAVEEVGLPQPLLGVLDDVSFEPDAVELAPGDLLVCVTDGVTERRNATGMLREEGLAEIVAGCSGLTAAEVAERIHATVVAFGDDAPRDDVAILVLRAT